MEYKLPLLPDVRLRFNVEISQNGERLDYSATDMRQYAEQAVAPLLAEIERLKRGEFICNQCGLRKNADTPEANF